MNSASLRTGLILAGLAVTAGTVSVPEVVAQGTVSIAPWAGIFVPTSNSFSTVGSDIKRRNSFIGGTRLTFWGGSSPLGLELTAGVAPARVTVAGATINADRSTNVFVGSAKLVVGLNPTMSPVSIHVGAGPAVIRHGRDLLRDDRSRTDFGGVLGFGVRFRISPMVGLRLDAEDYLYGGNFDGSKKFQNDLALTAGISLSF